MVEFAGYYMPLQFGGVTQEHLTVREGVGVFDVSHMGEVYIKGPKAFELAQYITSNDISRLEDGMVQYTCFPNETGGIVDDLLIYRINSENYLMVINASNIDKDWQWIQDHNPMGAETINASDITGQLAVQGPRADDVIRKITGEDSANIPYYTFKMISLAGFDNVILSNTGYTGSGGFEIYFPTEAGPAIWDLVFDAGEEYDIKPIGLAARDTLRLEMGFCLYGNDINETTSPLEAGLGWITKFTEGNDFVNRENLQKQKEEGVTRRLRGFVIEEKGIPRQHYEICDKDGNKIGEVTSGTMSPSLKIPIGMGYVDAGHAAFDSEIFIKIRNKLLKSRIFKPPFYKR
jgi:aminomethyltransferase